MSKLRFVTQTGARTRVYRITPATDIFLGKVWNHGKLHWIWETADGNWDGCDETRGAAAAALDKAYDDGWTKRVANTTVIPFVTVTLELSSIFAIRTVVERLINNGQFFAVMPKGNDLWDITVKPDVDLVTGTTNKAVVIEVADSGKIVDRKTTPGFTAHEYDQIDKRPT